MIHLNYLVKVIPILVNILRVQCNICLIGLKIQNWNKCRRDFQYQEEWRICLYTHTYKRHKICQLVFSLSSTCLQGKELFFCYGSKMYLFRMIFHCVWWLRGTHFNVQPLPKTNIVQLLRFWLKPTTWDSGSIAMIWTHFLNKIDKLTY